MSLFSVFFYFSGFVVLCLAAFGETRKWLAFAG